VVLVVAIGGAWFVFKGPKGTRLQIKSVPSGAKVFVNSVEVGTAPMSQPLSPGDKLRLELKGHQPVTYEVKPGEAPPDLSLQPIISDELLDSLPPGATVVLDEKKLEGVTPLHVSWNQGKHHRLTLTKDKLVFPKDFDPGDVPGGQVFKLMEGTTAETRQEPALDPHAPGALKLAGGFSIHLKAGGKDLGELSPGSKAPLSPGTHQLELTNARHFYKETRAVTVLAGQTSTLTVPGLATLTVETYPGIGKVLVDGQDSGIESDGSAGLQVAQGRHTITVRGAKGSKTESVDLTGDKSLRFPL
jgi:hypothetical protein